MVRKSTDLSMKGGRIYLVGGIRLIILAGVIFLFHYTYGGAKRKKSLKGLAA